MSVGSISTLGVGSGLELQSILDDLRRVDEKQRIAPLERNISRLQSQLEAFSVVQNKLLDMRGHVRTLSLESTYLSRTVTSSSESVFTATVSGGAAVQANSITVDRLATKSSWQSETGFANRNAAINFIPTSQHSTTGVANLEEIVLAEGASITIEYGENLSFTVTAAEADMSAGDLINAINAHGENSGSGTNNRAVTAESYLVGDQTRLRIVSDTEGGRGAEHEVRVGDNQSTLEFAAPPMVFQYKFGPEANATTVSLELEEGTTLEQLVDKINSQSNPGITASIVDTGMPSNPYQLVLRSNGTGENNRITVIDNTDLANLALVEHQGSGGAGSLNAQVAVDGIVYQRQNNTISDIFAGVSFDLHNPGSSTLRVTSNDGDIRDLVVGLIAAYNATVQEVADKVSFDEKSSEFGVLARTTVQGLRHELQGLMTSMMKGDGSGQVKSLFDLGMEFRPDGSITINTAVLDKMLAEKGDAVRGFFLGDSGKDLPGFADLIHERLGSIASSGGVLATEKDTAESRIRNLEIRITSETERLSRHYAVLTRRFVALDQYMSQMTNMSNYLSSQFESLSSLTSGKKR